MKVKRCFMDIETKILIANVILSALLVSATIYIGYRQNKIQKNQIKLELYKHKKEIFDNILKILSFADFLVNCKNDSDFNYKMLPIKISFRFLVFSNNYRRDELSNKIYDVADINNSNYPVYKALFDLEAKNILNSVSNYIHLRVQYSSQLSSMLSSFSNIIDMYYKLDELKFDKDNDKKEEILNNMIENANKICELEDFFYNLMFEELDISKLDK